MLAAAGVGVLVAGSTVKHVQAVGVLGEVGGHPVQDHADARTMHLVHKGHEVVGGTVAAGGCVVSADLIAPAAVKGIFGDGQQLHVGVAHIQYVGDEFIRQFGIVVGHTVRLHLPATGMQLIDEHGSVDHIALFLFFFPGGIAPGEAAQVIDLAAVGGAGLGVEGIRVGLVCQLIRRRGDAVFVHIKLLHTGNKHFPDTVVHLLHQVGCRNPVVEIAHHGDSLCMRRPKAEHNARLAVLLTKVCAEIAVSLHVISLPEQIDRQVGSFWHLFLLFQFDLPL